MKRITGHNQKQTQPPSGQPRAAEALKSAKDKHTHAGHEQQREGDQRGGGGEVGRDKPFSVPTADASDLLEAGKFGGQRGGLGREATDEA